MKSQQKASCWLSETLILYPGFYPETNQSDVSQVTHIELKCNIKE
ncbi:hypothetical protein THIOSC13_70086 [uncultured Thiomicrorhabdus sp.]